METNELIRALKRIVVLDNHRCLGCEYDNNCSIHGCAIVKATIDALEALQGCFVYRRSRHTLLLSQVFDISDLLNLENDL